MCIRDSTTIGTSLNDVIPRLDGRFEGGGLRLDIRFGVCDVVVNDEADTKPFGLQIFLIGQLLLRLGQGLEGGGDIRLRALQFVEIDAEEFGATTPYNTCLLYTSRCV